MSNEIIVKQGYVGLLYENGAFIESLSPGVYKLQKHWFDRTRRQIELVDMRERSITIKGQEILTADKVAIRVSLLVYFRIVDPEAAHNARDEDKEESEYATAELGQGTGEGPENGPDD